MFCEGALPFEVVASRPTVFSIVFNNNLTTSIGGTPVGKFPIECCMGFYG